MVTIRMSAKEARDNFSDILGRAYYRSEPTIVEKQGKPMAVVISPEQYAQFQQQQKQSLFQTIDEIHERNRDVDPAVIESEVAQAVTDVRQERHAQRTPRRD